MLESYGSWIRLGLSVGGQGRAFALIVCQKQTITCLCVSKRETL